MLVAFFFVGDFRYWGSDCCYVGFGVYWRVGFDVDRSRDFIVVCEIAYRSCRFSRIGLSREVFVGSEGLVDVRC